MRQVSLVAFYGRERRPLKDFLRTCQDRIGAALRRLDIAGRFCPAPLSQMHATVVGLERVSEHSLENRNFEVLRGRSKVMRLSELFKFILTCEYLPCHVQFGGFEDREYPFQSRGARPYHRSFSLQGRTAVVIGWPARAASGRSDQSSRATVTPRKEAPAYPTNLEDLRRRAQRFHVLHRWHRQPADVDNDLYIRLGFLESQPADPERALIENEIRSVLSALPPLVVELAIADLSVVSYPADDETLPEARSGVFRLTDPRLQDERFIAALYD